MKKLFSVLILLLLHLMFIYSQVVSTGKVPVLINNMPEPEVKQNIQQSSEQESPPAQPAVSSESKIGAGKYYAIVIGINNYDDTQISPLDYAIRDAELFYNTITTRYNFEPQNVSFLKNATYENIINALDFYTRTIQPADNFLIFYAGHGYWNEKSQTGFWLPSDAQKNGTSRWFRNSVLRDYLREIRSKHTLLITDACFSGSILKTRSAFTDAPVAINKLYDLPSRKAMTSGTLNEVPDQSAFLKYLVDRLQNNNVKYLSSEQLFSNFRMAVINNSRAIPQFGVIQDVGDEGGDFIFILK